MRRFSIPSFVICLVLVFSSASQAEDTIFYRMAHKGETISFFSFNAPLVPPVARDIALMTLNKPFYPNHVNSEYYQLSITRGIIWQGMKVIQYDYAPLTNDRFRHILWTTENPESVVMLEVYDNDNKLLYGAIRLSQRVASSSPSAKKTPEQHELYFGFAHQHTEVLKDGGIRLFFSDGLNKFSIFRSPIPAKASAESNGKADFSKENLVLYGNYVYCESKNGFRYTVVGTIPFDKMAEMIDLASVLYEENVEINKSDQKGKSLNNAIVTDTFLDNSSL